MGGDLSLFWPLAQGPQAISCLSSSVSLPSGAASGPVLRPCRPPIRLTMQTLREELGSFHREPLGTDTGPRWTGPQRFAHEHLAGRIYCPPVTQKTKPCLFLWFCSCLGLVSAAGPCTERGTAPDGHGHMALKVLIKKVEEWRFFFLSARP